MALLSLCVAALVLLALIGPALSHRIEVKIEVGGGFSRTESRHSCQILVHGGLGQRPATDSAPSPALTAQHDSQSRPG
jgi:hypothetical protein